jgi:hypothetical protein
MRLRDLKGSNVFVLEDGDDRVFLGDLFELEACGDPMPLLDRDASEFLLYDRNYRPISHDEVKWK